MRNWILKAIENYDTNNFDGYTLHKGLKCINQYYYIENKNINYNNSSPHHQQIVYDKLYDAIIDFFDKNDKIFLYKLSIYGSGDILDMDDLTNIDKIIRKIKKDESFNISSQNLTHEQKLFLDDIIKYIFDYCEQNNLKINRPTWNNHNFDCWGNKSDILIFYIDYNNFEYKYVIRKINRKLVFKIVLRNNKEYRINLYDKTDFLNVLKCMYNDK